MKIFIDESFDTHKLSSESKCKIILLEKGNVFITISNKKQTISAPSLICLNHKESIGCSSDEKISVRVLYFDPKVLNDAFDEDFVNNVNFDLLDGTVKQDFYLLSPFYNRSKSNIYGLSYDMYLKISNLFSMLQKELSEPFDSFWPCRSRSYFIEMLFSISNINSDLSNESQVDVVENIIEYLSEKISEKVMLSDLTTKFLINRNKLNSEFKKRTDMTIMQFLNKLRIDVSTRLLTHTHLTISEIGLRVGYDNPSDFSKFYRIQTNKSPSEVRKNFVKTIDINVS